MDKVVCKILEPAAAGYSSSSYCNYNYLELPAADCSNYSGANNRWWSKETVAVVTGANKGIGFALVKRLAELGLRVVLTARDEKKGAAALDSLKRVGVGGDNVELFVLDVSKPDSIATFASWLQNTHGGVVDILVNNAAITSYDSSSISAAESVIRTNFYGPKLVIEALLPMLIRRRSISSSSPPPPPARILNISSRLGSLDKLRDLDLRASMEDLEHLSEDKIVGMLDMFLSDYKQQDKQQGGWPEVWTDYSVSKLALNAYSKLLARRYKHQGITVNCFCPGFTQTSMTQGKGTHTPDHAASIAATFALLPPHLLLPTGIFFLAPRPRPPNFISNL
ncbi:short-chain dehydrogenase/reductase 2b-like [Impatiens glandulifera]|uniref:short-chain dehydrogenase/reductase 2b-like n=1 Tax=Impatiens glandulifera TaxID=253017 RepID=UPI001FB106D5|nr:short-chain dehydrogenase/reductase 2b-like [Impatiens glandulifera]